MISPFLLQPQWPAPTRVRSAYSQREGGVSSAPYDTLNLGSHVGDSAQAVAVNRSRYAAALGVRAVFLQQVHGLDVLTLQGRTPDDALADASVCAQTGLACTIMVADCLPVLFCNRSGTVVGAAHAGWRGLCGSGGGGILERTLSQLMALYIENTELSAIDCRADQWQAWLGPCIGPGAFEVGPEVREAFVRDDAAAAACFTAQPANKFLADLPQLARQRLLRLGVSDIYGNDGSAAWCTVSNPSRFFSHRRDRISGRIAASIWLA